MSEGADWLRRFAAYNAALAAHGRAQGCASQLQARLAASTSDGERAAISDGVALAQRRVSLTGKGLALATNAFTQGLSVLEAVWDAPDEV